MHHVFFVFFSSFSLFLSRILFPQHCKRGLDLSASRYIVQGSKKIVAIFFASGDKKVVVVVLLRGRFFGCIDDVYWEIEEGVKKSRGRFEPANVFLSRQNLELTPAHSRFLNHFSVLLRL